MALYRQRPAEIARFEFLQAPCAAPIARYSGRQKRAVMGLTVTSSIWGKRGLTMVDRFFALTMVESVMHSPLAIANEFIRKAHAEQRSLTHMQLQKLVYLAHGWCLAVTGNPLIEDEFEAWEFGPVERKLYQALRRHGAGPVKDLIKWGDDTPFPDDDLPEEAYEELLPQERQVIDKVWESYGKFPAYQLSALTHQPGTPWTAVYEQGRNRSVANTAIQEYFIRLADPP